MRTDAYRCTACRRPGLRVDGSTLRCECGAAYPVVHGTVDLLGDPGHDVGHELEGIASENGVTLADGYDAVKHLRVDRVESTAELMAASRGDHSEYYQHTTAAWFEGLARIRPDAGMKVLEIGGERSHFPLRTIEDLCDEAYALNVFFHVTPEDESRAFPTRVLGDMNDLPFADGYFDLVAASATLHHTTSPEKVLREVARVLRPGGRALVVNEPVEGALKAWGADGAARDDRDEHIHEVPITMRQWQRAIAASGLRADHFLPAWFLQQVASSREARRDMRFGGLARALSPVLRRPAVQEVARLAGRWPAQHTLGLPLNVVLWKD